MNSSLKDQRAILKDKIQGYEQLRSVYIPGLVQLLAERGENVSGTWDSDPDPEEVPLWLPSAIPSHRRRAACVEDLPKSELKLRTAQCSSSLHELKQVLRLKTRMVYFKNKNIRGQREGTRSRSIIDRVHQRAIRSVQKYRAARHAKLGLEGSGDWENIFKELKNDDIRSYTVNKKKSDPQRRGIWEDGHGPPSPPAADDIPTSNTDSESDLELEDDIARLTEQQLLKKRKKGTGETRKELSWIWTATSASRNLQPGEADHILRAEWAKSRARTNRAREEVELLLEEMRRVIAFLEHSMKEWGDRIVQRTSFVDSALMEGLQSYGNKQILLQQSLLASFRQLWKIPLREIENNVNTDTSAEYGIGHDNIDGDYTDDDETDDENDNEDNNTNQAEGHDEDGDNDD